MAIGRPRQGTSQMRVVVAQDRTLPASALTWTVIRHHADHTHPYAGPLTGKASSLAARAPEDLAATTNSSVEVRLTATDSRCAMATVTRVVSPKLVNLTFATKLRGLTRHRDVPKGDPQRELRARMTASRHG